MRRCFGEVKRKMCFFLNTPGRHTSFQAFRVTFSLLKPSIHPILLHLFTPLSSTPPLPLYHFVQTAGLIGEHENQGEVDNS